jgi:hypothetical protein
MTDEQILNVIKSVCGFDSVGVERWRTEALIIGRAIEQASRRAALEEVAAQWDGCIYRGIGEDIDIGSSIRNIAKETNNG